MKLYRLLLLALITVSTATVYASNVNIGSAELDNVVKTVDYILRNKPDKAKTDSLLATLPVFTLTDALPAIDASGATPLDVVRTVNAIYVIANLRAGYTLEESRDAVYFTTLFPFRQPNSLDFKKLDDVFRSGNTTVQNAYMSVLPFTLRNSGPIQELLDMKDVIIANVADSPERAKLIGILDSYACLSPGKMAPDAVFTDADGTTHRLSDYRGKTVVIDVWATWCHNCIKKMPYLHELREKYEPSDKVTFLTVSIDRRNDTTKWLNASQKYSIAGRNNLIVDTDDTSDFEKTYQINGIPRYIIIDANGRIADSFAPAPDKGMDEAIKNTL